MALHKTLLSFLFAFFRLGVVDGEGGGAEVVEDDAGVQDDDAAGDAAGDESGDDTGDAANDAAAGDAGAADGDTEIVVSLGDKPETDEDEAAIEADLATNAGQPAAAAFAAMRLAKKDLRDQLRNQAIRLRELEDKVATGQPAAQAIVVGDEPELEEFADAEAISKYKKDLAAWSDRKRKVEEQAAEKKRHEDAERAAWQTKLDGFRKTGAAKFKDFTEAEQVVASTFSITQQGLLVKAPEKAAEFSFALSKNPATAKKLAAIQDPVDFLWSAAEIYFTKMKVTTKKTAPLPERRVQSTVAGAAGLKDAELARLQAEADKTGDRSKVAAFIRKKNQAKQAA